MIQNVSMQNISSYPGDERFHALLARAAANLSALDYKLQVHKIMESSADPAHAVEFLLAHLDARKCSQDAAGELVGAALGLWNDLARERNRQRVGNRLN